MKKTTRKRQFMYVQQVSHLKIELNNIKSILNKSNCDEWAYIVHDKDHTGEGIIVETHIHCVLRFLNPQTVAHVASIFKDKENQVDIWEGRINNAYSYLIHRTDSAKNKFQYPPEKVVASFNFPKKIEEITTISKGAREKSPKLVQGYISEFSRNEITLNELKEKIGIYNYAKNMTLIDKIIEIQKEKEHREWLTSFNGHKMKTYWLWGLAGVGKSTLARYLLRNKEFITLGSSRDYFQDYNGEKFVIWDDLRPDEMKYSDLLRITDPYNHDKHAPRRYHDVPLNLECLVITTPYSPQQFYKELDVNNKVDKFEQLGRRLFAKEVTTNFLSQIGLEKDAIKTLKSNEIAKLIEEPSKD